MWSCEETTIHYKSVSTPNSMKPFSKLHLAFTTCEYTEAISQMLTALFVLRPVLQTQISSRAKDVVKIRQVGQVGSMANWKDMFCV